MAPTISPRFDHLRRLTDSQGLLHAARGDVPDRFGGYEAIDNAAALRLCAVGTETVDAELSHVLARTYYGFLSRGRHSDSGVRHRCDASGGWINGRNDSLVQSNLARALATVIVSELPITIRLSAADRWRMLLEEHTPRPQSPLPTANWLIALGQLRAADPGRDVSRAEMLAHWLMEGLYYSNRTSTWDWFELEWQPMAALIPTSLWYAYHLLGEQRILRVAQSTTQFVIDHLFEDGIFQPAGNVGSWSPSSTKPHFDQLPAEVCSVVELLCTAECVSGQQAYGEYASAAARWFNGDNIRKTDLIDPTTGGCYDAITANGLNPNQGAQATLACLLTQAAIAARRVNLTERMISPTPTVQTMVQESVEVEVELVYVDPSIGS
ncbi:MAG: hypothetical protein FWC56_01585 [Phycisphaerae bacterium]|nr:hypothetical protein [Phycisphaerae bacterium]